MNDYHQTTSITFTWSKKTHKIYKLHSREFNVKNTQCNDTILLKTTILLQTYRYVPSYGNFQAKSITYGSYNFFFKKKTLLLKDFLKYKCELFLKQLLIPPWHKIVVAYHIFNNRLAIETRQCSTIRIHMLINCG